MEENQIMPIPRVIHYCWFGRNPLPKSARKCLESWRVHFPDYEIKEWNEDNFNVDIIPYTHDAYQAGKYAFVSDYARFWVLYRFGGVYFDTDVEVIRSMEDIISRGPYLGIETSGNNDEQRIAVNPGLGFAVQPGNPFLEKVLERYNTLSFYNEDGQRNPYSMIPLVTDLLRGKGLTMSSSYQLIDGIWIYPKDYFNPLNDATGKLCITDNTRSIHWYTKSWISSGQRVLLFVKKTFRRLFGEKIMYRLKSKFN